MKEIELTKGLSVKLDEEDFAYMNQWNWHIYASTKSSGLQTTTKIYRTVKEDGEKSTIEFGVTLLKYDQENEVLTFKNHDRLDFRRDNLLLVPKKWMRYHSAAAVSSNSWYKGVYYDKSKKRYIAKIQVEGKATYIGSSKDEEKAAEMYNRYAKELFGEYAYQNILGIDNRKPEYDTKEDIPVRVDKSSAKLWRGVFRK